MRDNYCINYLVACYLGERRAPRYIDEIRKNPFYFVKKHLEFLETIDINNSHIKKATFVFNINSKEEINLIMNYFKNYAENIKNNIQNPKIRILVRENLGLSYGAWDCGIIKNLVENNNEEDFFFLIEDDYIPKTKDFYKPFVEKCSFSTPYVCQYGVIARDKYHASISNGIILAEACKVILNNYEKVFSYEFDLKDYEYESSEEVYFEAVLCQINFYDYFMLTGFKLDDISDKYKSPFYDSKYNRIIDYGNAAGDELLIPI